MAAAGTTSFYVKDGHSGTKFLVDTGAQRSILPATHWDRQGSQGEGLKAANQTDIKTYGTRTVMLKFGDKLFEHVFTIADLPHRFLGMDFFKQNGLSIDAENEELFKRGNGETICAVMAEGPGQQGPEKSTSSAVQGQQEMFDLLDKFPEILTPNFHNRENKHRIEHYIETNGHPVFAKPRRLDQAKLEAAKAEFAELERLGIIRRSNSPWSSPLHVVPKANGKLRPCGNYRRLNEMTVDDKYPLPHIHDFNERLLGSTIFSKVDLIRGYHQVPVAEKDIQKTAIVTPFGLWEYVRMPFGLKNAAQRFQRLMDKILDGLPWAFVYLDDVLVASKTRDEHMDHLRQLFQIFADNGLVVNRDKCELGVAQLNFLAHRVSSKGILPMPQTVEKILAFPKPTDKAGLQRFLGMINYYHRFMPKIAQTLIPLHKAVGDKSRKGPKSIEWNEDCDKAFKDAKDALSKATLLSHPGRDAETTLTVDASDIAIGGVLEQKVHGKFRPISFFSKKLSQAERKYSAFDRELLGIVRAIEHFRHFVEGRPFTIYTDHKPLTTVLSSQTERSPRQTRHLSFIAEFTSDIRHVKGVDNEVADNLSRVEAIRAIEATASQVDVNRLAEEQRRSNEVQAYLGNRLTGLEVTKVQFGKRSLLCDISTGRTRTVLPLSMRRDVFKAFHELAHAGPKPTQKAVLHSFVWKNAKKDIINWCKTCEECQESKVARHVHTPVVKRDPPDRRFGSIHVDLVGPLPECEGYKYLFTIVDRWTRWPEAIPVKDMTAQTCARALIRSWISRFGLPTDITADRGRQFTSDLWKQMGSMLGMKMNNTTSYHPQANGLVERLHRQLKASIMARSKDINNWMDHLPIAMLGTRTAWRTELDCSPAELVYGMSLTVPGLLVGDRPQAQPDLPSSEFVQDLWHRMNQLRPTEMAHHTVPKVQVPSSIAEAKWVYVRTDAVRQPLVRPYTGPYKVLSKAAKFFTISKNGSPDTVSLDRLKPAFKYENNNIEETNTVEKPENKITQPRVSSPNSETSKVPTGTPDVAGSFPGNREGFSKRTYVKRKPEVWIMKFKAEQDKKLPHYVQVEFLALQFVFEPHISVLILGG